MVNIMLGRETLEAFPIRLRNKIMILDITDVQHYAGGPRQCNKTWEINEVIKMENKRQSSCYVKII